METVPTAVNPEFVQREASRVRIITPSAVIEGSHHHPPGVRLSDTLRNQVNGERYMMLTEATIGENGGDESSAPFVLISSAHASVIIPLES